jgi:hypothetical protein
VTFVFVAVQFPLADLRRFVPPPTGRLAAPPWPLADPRRHFVRSVGSVRDRRRGGAPEWLGENVYCEARELVKFRSTPGEPLCGSSGGIPVRGVYRRLFAGGNVSWAGAVCRAEAAFVTVGPRRRSRPVFPRTRPEIEREWLTLSCLSLPALVPGVTTTERPFGELGDCIAERMLDVTTSVTRPVEPKSWWITAGRPLILLESDTGALDASRYFVSAPAIGSEHGWLAGHEARTVERAGTRTPVWALLYNRSADPDAGRRLRIHLWRLHTEREVLRLVLAKCIEGALDPGFPALRDYLARQSEQLYRKQRNGFPQRDMLGLAQDVDQLVNEDRIAELREILCAVSPGISAAVVAVAEAAFAATRGNVYLSYQESGQMTVHNEGQHIAGGQIGAVVGGDVSGGAFQGSGFQQVGGVLADTDLSTLATELGRLRMALKTEATAPLHDVEVAAIAEAQLAAEAGDKDTTLGSLRKASKWALGVATTIGTTVAAAVIKAAIGA